jgi:hypothetical protein
VNGAPGPCVGQVVPQVEICDARDNDCDGRDDDLDAGQGCACRVGDTRACYSGARLSRGVGICTDGVQSCLPDGTGWGPCDGEVLPQAEQCNGLDDNCNGEVDDSVVGVGLDCTVGLGVCARSSIAVCDPAQGVICPVEAGEPAGGGVQQPRRRLRRPPRRGLRRRSVLHPRPRHLSPRRRHALQRAGRAGLLGRRRPRRRRDV